MDAPGLCTYVQSIAIYSRTAVPKALYTQNRRFVFERAVEVFGIDEKVITSIESEKAGGQGWRVVAWTARAARLAAASQ